MGNCFIACRICGDVYLVKAAKEEIVITLI